MSTPPGRTHAEQLSPQEVAKRRRQLIVTHASSLVELAKRELTDAEAEAGNGLTSQVAQRQDHADLTLNYALAILDLYRGKT